MAYHSHSHPDSTLSDILSSLTLAQTTRSLQRIARSVVRDDALAEDIVQSAWVEALERKAQSRGFGWLRTLVRSRSIDALRRRSQEPIHLQSGVESNQPQPDGALGERLEIQREVLDAVDSLKEPYRSTLFLRYFEDLAPSEIAARKDLPVKTVKNRLTKAHTLLRERLHLKMRDSKGQWSPGLLAFSGFTPPPALPLSVSVAPLLMKNLVATLALCLALFSGWRVLQRNSNSQLTSPEVGVTQDLAKDRLTSPEAELSATQEDALSREVIAMTSPSPSAMDSVPPVAQAPHGALRVKVVRQNGEPASNVHVIASTHPGDVQLHRQFRHLTDAKGFAYFKKLPAGSLRLRSDRVLEKERCMSEIHPGKVTETELVLGTGIHVAGRVLDRERRPVAKAAVWLTADLDGWARGGIVTYADESGYFEIENVPSDQSIGALAVGFSPSDLVDLDTEDKTLSPVQIELILNPGGAQLSGIVVDDSGEPIEGALVVVGEPAKMMAEIEEGAPSIENWSPQSSLTDAEGHFSFAGLHRGPTLLQARSTDHALWTGDVDLENGSETKIELTLHAGVLVRGRVTTQDGVAGPNVIVRAFTEPLDELYLQSGQVVPRGTMANPVVITDEDGRFELTGVAPGEAWLYAVEQRKDRWNFHEIVLYAKANLHLAQGSETTWNPVLSEGLVIEGHAFYSDGEPIQGVFVLLEDEEGQSRAARADENGFRFTNLEERPYTLRVQMWTKPDGQRDPFLEGVLPGGPPLRVTATFPAPKETVPAEVRVRVLDRGKRATGSPAVRLARVDRYGFVTGTAKGDLWTFQIETPGTYRAVALQEDRVIGQSESFVVHSGDRLELEDLVTTEGGTLILHFDRPLDHSTEDLRAYVRTAPNGHTETFSVGTETEVRLENLEAGPGILTLQDGQVVQLKLDYEVRAGEETTLSVPLIPAVAVEYEIRWPISAGEGSLLIRFIDRATGLEAHRVDIDDLAQFTSPISWSVLLPVGQFLYEVKMNGTVHASKEFEINSLNPFDAPRLSAE